MGGTDQVTLTTMEELRHLRELDPKLWGALSCPATGIEFDQRTIALLDADGDGRIRMPEVLDAVEWLCARINDTANITGEPAYVPLSVIDTTNEQGQRLLTTANTVLGHLGRKGIVAKKAPADKDGVRIAELDEMSYRRELWDYRPLTKFWRVGRGITEKLAVYGIDTMGKIARMSIQNEGLLYRLFGVNAELLIDHAWGWEPCTMEAVKAYRPETNSFSSG